MHTAYGTAPPSSATSDTARILELLRIRGFAELPDLLSAEEVADLCHRLDAVYQQQEAEFGAETLEAIGEAHVARCLLAYDAAFLELARHPRVLAIARAVVGDYVVLHLQNGIIVHPQRLHHQSSWHRDLPYQEFVSSRPLAVNVFVCLGDFRSETGGTAFLPFSHRQEKLPSRDVLDLMEEQPVIPAGSAVVFDSMLFHRAGHNSSHQVRRGVNQVFTTGILRQQIDLPGCLPRQSPELDARVAADPELRVLLGYEARTAESVSAYRQRRLEALRRRQQS